MQFTYSTGSISSYHEYLSAVAKTWVPIINKVYSEIVEVENKQPPEEEKLYDLTDALRILG